MEHYKISKLLNDSTVSKFVSKKWIKVNDATSGQYSVNKNIRFKTSMLRSYLFDYRDGYIVVKGTIDLLAAVANENNQAQKNVAFKNDVPFRSGISRLNSTWIDNAEDLDIVIPMSSGSLWNYYRDEVDDVDDNAPHGKSFNYKTKILGKTTQ